MGCETAANLFKTKDRARKDHVSIHFAGFSGLGLQCACVEMFAPASGLLSDMGAREQ